MTNKEIRRHSWERLKKQWYVIFIALLITALISGVISVVFKNESGDYGFVASILNYITAIIFTLILAKISLLIANEEKFSWDKIKFRFKDYFRVFIFIVLYTILIFGVVMIGVAIVGGSLLAQANSVSDIKLMVFSNLLLWIIVLIAVFAIIIIFDLNYGFSVYIISEKNDDIGAIDAMKYSRYLIKGNRIRFILLLLPPIIIQIVGLVAGVLIMLTGLTGIIIGAIVMALVSFIVSMYTYILSADFYLEILAINEDEARDYGIINMKNEYNFRTITPTDIKSVELIEETTEENISLEDKKAEDDSAKDDK